MNICCLGHECKVLKPAIWWKWRRHRLDLAELLFTHAVLSPFPGNFLSSALTPATFMLQLSLQEPGSASVMNHHFKDEVIFQEWLPEQFCSSAHCWIINTRLSILHFRSHHLHTWLDWKKLPIVKRNAIMTAIKFILYNKLREIYFHKWGQVENIKKSLN